MYVGNILNTVILLNSEILQDHLGIKQNGIFMQTKNAR